MISLSSPLLLLFHHPPSRSFPLMPPLDDIISTTDALGRLFVSARRTGSELNSTLGSLFSFIDPDYDSVSPSISSIPVSSTISSSPPCSHLKKDGTPCKGRRVKSSSFCSVHNRPLCSSSGCTSLASSSSPLCSKHRSDPLLSSLSSLHSKIDRASDKIDSLH